MYSEETKIARKVVSSAAALGLAVVLLGLLIGRADVSLSDITSILSRIGPMHMVLILVGMSAPVALGALKWRLVLARVLPGPVPGTAFLTYFTALAIIVGQVTSQYISGPVVRGLALRRLETGGFGKGATTSGFEQLFDAWATLVFAIAGIALVASGAPTLPALLCLGTAAVIGAWAVTLPVQRRIAKILEKRNLSSLRNLGQLLDNADKAGLFEPALLVRLHWLSVVRFWVLVLVAIAVGHMTTGIWQPAEMAVAFAAAKITRFAALSPGNLGIEEWGWVVVLLGLGWSLEQAAAFSLSLRVIGVAMMLPVFAFTAVWRMTDK